MKFGIESEKILFDARHKTVAHTAYRLLDALNDYKVVYGSGPIDRVLGEFVLNMIELTSSPSEDLLEVAGDYMFSYELIRDVAARGGVVPLPIASYPCSFQPIMAAKWTYFLQNAILSNNPQVGWNLKSEHKIFDAANCAGVHIHIEVETPSEFVALSSEFATKHNIASFLTPLIAFSSSPYFAGTHEAMSMRAKKYYFGVYDELPMFGGKPLVTDDPSKLLQFYYDCINQWEDRGANIGIDKADIRRITSRMGAHWGFIRWNRKWNTIELRFLDTDFVDMNLAKLAVVMGVTKKIISEWKIRIIPSPKTNYGDLSELNQATKESVDNLIDAKSKSINIPNEPILHHIIDLAINEGLKNELVYSYLLKVIKLARTGLKSNEEWLLSPLLFSLKKRKSTSDIILDKTTNKAHIEENEITDLIEGLIFEEDERFKKVRARLPSNLQPPSHHPFPQGEIDIILNEWNDWKLNP